MKNPDSNHALDLSAALARIAALVGPVAAPESVPLRTAVGRISAERVDAQAPSPPFAASAMDGYAVAPGPAEALHGRRFSLVGESAAGHPFSGSVHGDACVRIFTGAAIPEGTGRVILQEDCTREGATVQVNGHPEARSNIRPPGHDVEAGECLVEAGRMLTPVDLGRLATDGRADVRVHGRARVAVFSTGDELVEPGTVPALPWGCIFESNRQTLLAQLTPLPVILTDLGNLPDTADASRRTLTAAAANHDFIITSGGVSVGDHDHIRAAVESLGTLDFWKLNLKPGKPMAFGRIGNAWFCGLPGNPVSAIVTWLLVARPALLAACGARPREPLRLPAALGAPVAHKAGRAEYQRGFLAWDGRSPLPTVTVQGDQSSNRLSTFRNANCLVEIPDDVDDLPAGAQVSVLPWDTF